MSDGGNVMLSLPFTWLRIRIRSEHQDLKSLYNFCCYIYFYFYIFYSCAHLSIYVHVKKIIANMDKMHLFFLYCWVAMQCTLFSMLWYRVSYIAMAVSKTKKTIYNLFFSSSPLQSCQGILFFLNMVLIHVKDAINWKIRAWCTFSSNLLN